MGMNTLKKYVGGWCFSIIDDNRKTSRKLLGNLKKCLLL